MANTIPYPTFNWKATDQIRAWDLFQAKAELWLAGEEIKEEIQYTKIVLMLGDEGLSRWSKFDMGADARKIPKDVFTKFKESLGKDISFRTASERSHNLDRSFCNIYIVPSFPTREQHAHSVQNARSRFNKLNQSYSC